MEYPSGKSPRGFKPAYCRAVRTRLSERETETAIRPEGDYAGVSTPTDLRDPIPPEEPVPDNPSAEPAAGAPEEAPAADTEEAPADDTQEELPAAGAEEETSAAAMPVMPEGVMEPVRPVVAEQPAEPETDPAAGLFVLPTETEDAPEETDQPRLECKTKR